MGVGSISCEFGKYLIFIAEILSTVYKHFGLDCEMVSKDSLSLVVSEKAMADNNTSTQGTQGGFSSSFFDRVGTHVFQPPTQMWGYWPQINEWSRSTVTWHIERVGGQDHIPEFEGYPICEYRLLLLKNITANLHIVRGEELRVYTARAGSKKAVMEEASRMMALSGHCVR